MIINKQLARSDPLEARRLALVSQGLHQLEPFGTGKNAVQRCIEQIGYVQIDTISVINRSHHHCFWTRVPSYKEQHLDTLLREKKILEYWAHAAAYLPMADYRFCLPYMNAVASGQKHWRRPDRKAMAEVLARVRAEGPLMAKDFEHRGERTGHWGWNWKPAKIALEQLFIEGRLIATRRVGFQKVYDLPERALPEGLDTRVPTDEEFHRYLISNAIRAHGLVTEKEICYLRKGVKTGVKTALRDMLEAGEIIRMEIAGNAGEYYTTEQSLADCAGKRISGKVSLLSPFDNAVIQRKRLLELFAYDYQIECFVPAAKRRFGYYCLPILFGTDFVGRLDPKADRRKGEFRINSLHLEKPVKDEDRFLAALADTLRRTAGFNACPRVVYKPARRDRLGSQLVRLLDH